MRSPTIGPVRTMGTPAPARPMAARRRPSRFFRRSLALPDPATFPYRQSTPIAPEPPAATEARVRDLVAGIGFEPVRLARTEHEPPAVLRTAVVVERNFGRGPASLRKRAAIFGLLICGVILGVIDALLFKDPIFGVPWVLSVALLAFLLYWAFGRAYESDIVIAVIRPARPRDAAGAAERPGSILWLGAHVRSEVFSSTPPSTREAVEVVGELSALQSVAEAARAYAALGTTPGPGGDAKR